MKKEIENSVTKKEIVIFDLDGTLADISHRRHFVRKETIPCPACPDHQGFTMDFFTNPPTKTICPVCKGKGSRKAPQNWEKFFMACVDDSPKWETILTLRALKKAGYLIYIFSGRSAMAEKETVQWLDKYDVDYDKLIIRDTEGEKYTKDDELKLKWLNDTTIIDRNSVLVIFDDRNKVVDMWRREGIPCFQVAPGDF